MEQYQALTKPVLPVFYVVRYISTWFYLLLVAVDVIIVVSSWTKGAVPCEKN